jgi:hypothetical protein
MALDFDPPTYAFLIDEITGVKHHVIFLIKMVEF